MEQKGGKRLPVYRCSDCGEIYNTALSWFAEITQTPRKLAQAVVYCYGGKRWTSPLICTFHPSERAAIEATVRRLMEYTAFETGKSK